MSPEHSHLGYRHILHGINFKVRIFSVFENLGGLSCKTATEIHIKCITVYRNFFTKLKEKYFISAFKPESNIYLNLCGGYEELNIL
jgi:hypothetical protein